MTTLPIASPSTGHDPAPSGDHGPHDHGVERLIEHHAHLLPSQGPISVFVHHNTLHAFEELCFSEAVSQAADLYDCHPYLPEAEYRRAVGTGRIAVEDLQAVLYDDLGDEGDRLIGRLGTRHELRMSMLAHALHEGAKAEIEWFVGEAEALYHFRTEAAPGPRRQVVDGTRRWVVRDYCNGAAASCPVGDEIDALLERFGGAVGVDRWDEPTAEAFSLHTLWAVCRHGASRLPAAPTTGAPRRDGPTHERINSLLIRFSAAFLDQGQAAEIVPNRSEGFLRSFLTLYRDARLAERWTGDLPQRIREIDQQGLDAVALIEQSLDLLRVAPSERSDFLLGELLNLRGWAGQLWQMETNAEWTVWPAPSGTLVEYVAVRLLLLTVSKAAAQADTAEVDSGPPIDAPKEEISRAFVLFQIAQIRGWSGVDLLGLSEDEWAALFTEIESFSSRERRRVFHLAYERHYRDRAFNAVRDAALKAPPPPAEPAYQVICCLDDREESFRRHLEEVDPGCETFGVAGFYGVAMYYKGLGEAHYRPLCPVNVRPQHYIDEEPVYSEAEASRRRAVARRAIGKAAHGVTLGSRTVLGGLVTGLLGAVATAPLVLRVVAPRLASALLGGVGRFVNDRRTQLRLETAEPPSDGPRNGYTVDEMATVVGGVLRTTGLPRRWSPLVVICGHGSSSLNNPHAAAYDCGACGGGRGGPNARAFALMANDARVRSLLEERGLPIPTTTTFVGAYHNTCDDSVDFYDLDSLPGAVEGGLGRVRHAVDEARCRDAHERARRFESARLDATPERALRHVEGRAADLSQVRSECGHATNALCLVGRRQWNRGLFLDRRAFLTSYDPLLDDDDHSVLANLLAAVIPVCAGINLEYYFSRIDNNGYGCGTKLPHNVTSLLGVMDGAGSDLRTGLPWQMVEIHEPMRILFVIETTPEAMLAVMGRNAAIDRLVRGDWVQVATLDPSDGSVHRFGNGRFEPHEAPLEDLPVVTGSGAWYRGQRDHLGFALVHEAGNHDTVSEGAR